MSNEGAPAPRDSGVSHAGRSGGREKEAEGWRAPAPSTADQSTPSSTKRTAGRRCRPRHPHAQANGHYGPEDIEAPKFRYRNKMARALRHRLVRSARAASVRRGAAVRRRHLPPWRPHSSLLAGDEPRPVARRRGASAHARGAAPPPLRDSPMACVSPLFNGGPSTSGAGGSLHGDHWRGGGHRRVYVPSRRCWVAASERAVSKGVDWHGGYSWCPLPLCAPHSRDGQPPTLYCCRRQRPAAMVTTTTAALPSQATLRWCVSGRRAC